MRKFLWLLVASIPFSVVLTAMAQSKPPRILAEFSAASLKWIHIAEPEFQRNKLDLDKYTISVVEQNDFVSVAITAPDRVKGARGNTGSLPGFVVEINKNDRKVLRSYYIR